MTNDYLKRWDDRYKANEYAYGIKPNNYLKEQLKKLSPGTILFPADGEGRNSVFAAILGWKVFSFDLSNEGRNKALQLAKNNDVKINYQVGELTSLKFDDEQFDSVALIYAHFSPEIRSVYHKQLDKYLRKDGIIIFEAFSKKHIEYRNKNEKVGGPKDIASLFSIEELKSDFNNYEIIELIETEIELNEGLYHNGIGSVIRFVGRKK